MKNSRIRSGQLFRGIGALFAIIKGRSFGLLNSPPNFQGVKGEERKWVYLSRSP